jgi:hypothetical protein
MVMSSYFERGLLPNIGIGGPGMVESQAASDFAESDDPGTIEGPSAHAGASVDTTGKESDIPSIPDAEGRPDMIREAARTAKDTMHQTLELVGDTFTVASTDALAAIDMTREEAKRHGDGVWNTRDTSDEVMVAPELAGDQTSQTKHTLLTQLSKAWDQLPSLSDIPVVPDAIKEYGFILVAIGAAAFIILMVSYAGRLIAVVEKIPGQAAAAAG